MIICSTLCHIISRWWTSIIITHYSVGNSKLAYARTVDHGKTWIELRDQKAGSDIPGVRDSGAAEPSVASDGSIYKYCSLNEIVKVKFQIVFQMSLSACGFFS